jgi:exodeoxyribonuclease VII small subunit
MSKPAGINASAKASSPEMPFEEALEKLESIVESMEEDDLPLETLLTRYEDGAKLAKACQSKLAEAETKIKKLEKTAAGEFELTELAPTDDND